jgi:hypothetical protein
MRSAARAVIERTARLKALRPAKETTDARDEAAPTTSAKKDGSIRTSPASGSLGDDTYRFFADIRRIAEQLTAVKRWYRIVGHALTKYLRGRQLPPPPPPQHAQPCPVRLKTAFGARVPTHGFSFIGARLSQTGFCGRAIDTRVHMVAERFRVAG